MPCIGEQGERVGEKSEDDLQNDEAAVEQDADKKRPPEIRGGVSVVMVVVAHGANAP